MCNIQMGFETAREA